MVVLRGVSRVTGGGRPACREEDGALIETTFDSEDFPAAERARPADRAVHP